jgi:ABC-type phosphate/phosphonate transport system substrate-binding protein
VIKSCGPFPIQPVVVRSALPEELKKRLALSLLRLAARALSEFGLQRFVPVTVEDYRCLWDDGGEGGGEERSAILVAKVSGRKRMGRT